MSIYTKYDLKIWLKSTKKESWLFKKCEIILKLKWYQKLIYNWYKSKIFLSLKMI